MEVIRHPLFVHHLQNSTSDIANSASQKYGSTANVTSVAETGSLNDGQMYRLADLAETLDAVEPTRACFSHIAATITTEAIAMATNKERSLNFMRNSQRGQACIQQHLVAFSFLFRDSASPILQCGHQDREPPRAAPILNPGQEKRPRRPDRAAIGECYLRIRL